MSQQPPIQYSPDGKYWWNGQEWVATISAPSAISERTLAIVALFMHAFAALPLVLALFISVSTPTYYGAFLSNGMGLAFLGISLLLLALWQLATYVAVRFLKRGRPAAGLILSLSPILFGLPSLWLVLLGPSFVILARR